MGEAKNTPSEGQVECAMCKKWIPASEAVYPEGHDYVLYFCGAECHAQWERERAAQMEETFEERSGVKRG
ncbi:MAG: DUF3330 domain-containing protein [Chromatiaceae bacterium]|jgi:hypothetical protein